MAASGKKLGRTEHIELADGTPVTLRPLNIKKLKEFMSKFKEVEALRAELLENKDMPDFEDRFMDIIVDMAAIALSNDLKDATAYLYDSEASREAWEEKVDQDTVSFINEVCGGIKFNEVNDAEDFPTTEDEA